MAIALSIFVILCCKFTVAYLITVQVMGKMTAPQNDDGVKFILAMSIAKEDAVKNAKGGAQPKPDPEMEEAASFQELPKNLREKTELRWKKMSVRQKDAFKEQMGLVRQVPPLFVAAFTFIAMFRWLDILWFLLCSFTAFRVASGATRS